MGCLFIAQPAHKLGLGLKPTNLLAPKFYIGTKTRYQDTRLYASLFRTLKLFQLIGTFFGLLKQLVTNKGVHQ